MFRKDISTPCWKLGLETFVSGHIALCRSSHVNGHQDMFVVSLSDILQHFSRVNRAE